MIAEGDKAGSHGGARSAYRIGVHRSISDVPAEAWDAVVGPDAVPFVRWGWIDALESSGSATARTGWEPRHLTLWRDGRLVGLCPAWRKHHSMGEYVYDFGWAEAAARLGIDYYPKLLIGVPLAPITATRFHAAAGEPAQAVRAALLDAALALARDEGCSSLHVIFSTEDEAAALEAAGMARRTGMQYHWKNPGYRTYDDFLARFGSKRRHQLRRERAAAKAQGIEIATRRGPLSPADADLAHRFYLATCDKNGWGQAQLTRDFFRRVAERFGSSVELVVASRRADVVAGAFNVVTADRLYGRYWGAFEEVPFLHFHVCLYHSIDESIRARRRVFEPGAGGEHKIPRGFEPTPIHSAHRIFDPRLDRAVRDYVARERHHLDAVFASASEIAGMKPWRGPA